LLFAIAVLVVGRGVPENAVQSMVDVAARPTSKHSP